MMNGEDFCIKKGHLCGPPKTIVLFLILCQNTILAAKVGLYFYSTKLFRDKICIINDFCLSLQLHIRKSMTVNAKDLPTNNLNVNEIEKYTPPNSLELGSGKEGESTDKPVNFYIIKLVSRILEMADEDYSVLTPIDRETLRDVLACGSIAKVAKKQHQSEANIRIKVNKAIDALTSQMKVWQELSAEGRDGE